MRHFYVSPPLLIIAALGCLSLVLVVFLALKKDAYFVMSIKHENMKTEDALHNNDNMTYHGVSPMVSTRHERIKYLEYASQSGWGNQLLCLERASYMAAALNRVLVLPPVLPHHGKGSVYWKTFTLHGKKLEDVYMKEKPYIPLAMILDLTFFHLPTIDFRALHSNMMFPNMTKHVIKDYSYLDTQWVSSSRNDLIGKTVPNSTELSTGEQVYRDLVHEMQPYEHVDILTFPSVFKKAFYHESFQEKQMLEVLYAGPIRTVAKSIAAELGTFAAVHIRGSDGKFKRDFYSANVIGSVLNGTGAQIEAYEKRLSQDSAISLYIATDLKHLQQRPEWIQQHHQLISRLNYTDVQIKTLQDYQEQVGALSRQLGIDASLFLDQQIASCANVGFTGTTVPHSSFTDRIVTLRSYNACNIP